MEAYEAWRVDGNLQNESKQTESKKGKIERRVDLRDCEGEMCVRFFSLRYQQFYQIKGFISNRDFILTE